MKIAIAGTGYVGLVTGVTLAHLGNDVWCIDVDKNKINNLNSGKCTIYEEGLEELMKKNKWRTFVLDLSFLGWDILSILTFGMVNILYANSYKTATSTELYVNLEEGLENSSN